MTNLKIISIAGVAVAGVVAALMIQYQSQVKFGERAALLQQQDQQLAALSREHQRLSSLVARAESAPSVDPVAELARLRVEAESLIRQTNDAGRRLEASRSSRPPQIAPNPPSHTPEYWAQLHQMAGGKTTDAMNLAAAFIFYAGEHQNQFPSNFDQMTPYQTKASVPFSGTNQFEIVLQGSFDNFRGIPPGTVAVVRNRQTWAGPDGKVMRVYGMADGSGQIVESDDNFQSWEAQHVILPLKNGPPGPP